MLYFINLNIWQYLPSICYGPDDDDLSMNQYMFHDLQRDYKSKYSTSFFLKTILITRLIVFVISLLSLGCYKCFPDVLKKTLIFLMSQNAFRSLVFLVTFYLIPRFGNEGLFAYGTSGSLVLDFWGFWNGQMLVSLMFVMQKLEVYPLDGVLGKIRAHIHLQMAFLYTPEDLTNVHPTPGGGWIPIDPNYLNEVQRNTSIQDGYGIIVSRPENLVKVSNFFTQLIYLFIFHLTTIFYYRRSAFFTLTALFSWEIALRTLYFLLVQYVSMFVANREYGLMMESSMYLDVFGHFFRFLMVFLMAVHRLSMVKFSMMVWVMRSRILILVSLCVLLAAIAAVVLIQTSDMKRLYIRSIGFVDSGNPGYQMLINRIFYIFPIGSIICYIILYFHIRRMSHQVMSRRTVQSGEQRVFIQLFITILFYGAMCAVFEYINTKDWASSPSEKINLVAVLNIVNYLPEISLPLMLLVSNTDMRRRISTIVGPKITKSATASVVPQP